MMEQAEESEPEWFVGIDWGNERHEVCVVDSQGQKAGGQSFAHSGDGLAQLVQWIASVTSMALASRIVVALELVRGALVATLVERGYRVYECNPKQTDRFRDRYSPAGAKDDRLDALVLADAARKDRELLREVPRESAPVVKLRELARMHTELTEDLVRATNRLREQWQRYYPQMLSFGNDLSETWRLDLWEMAPTPDSVPLLREPAVRALLSRHRIRRVKAKQVLEALRERNLHIAAGVADAASMHVATLVPQVRLLHEQLKSVDRRLDIALEDFASSTEPGEGDAGQESEQRDIATLRELPGAGRFVIATLLAEAYPALRDRDYHQLRALSGVAPVTRQTGKQKQTNRGARGPRPLVLMRRGCNERLREALFHWALNASLCAPKWRARAADLRQRGFTAGHRYRVIGDQLLRVLCACLKSGTKYDPSRLAAEVALVA